MVDRGLKRRRLVGIFLLGLVLTCYPILSIFNRPEMVFGFPLLYLYLFAVWTALIVLIVIVTRTRNGGYPTPPIETFENRED